MSIVLQWINGFLLVLSTILPLCGQGRTSGRYEVPLGEFEGSGFRITPVSDYGIVLYRRLVRTPHDQLELIRVDTAMQEVWRRYINVTRGLELLHACRSAEFLYFLVGQYGSVGSDFQLVKQNITTGDHEVFLIKNFIPFNATELIVSKDAALIGGYYGDRPVVLHYNIYTGQSKILPGFFNESGQLNQLKTLENGSVAVIVCARNSQRRKSLWIRRYSNSGELITTTLLQPKEKRHLIFGRSIDLPEGDQLVVGYYGRSIEYADGLFTARIPSDSAYTVRYYNFTELHNFFNFLRNKRQVRIQQRIEKSKLNGKEIRFSYRLLMNPILLYQGNYIITGEAFYPEYHSGYSTYRYSYLSAGRVATSFNPFLRWDLIFDDYLYSHAIVVGVDKTGHLLWDDSFKTKKVRSKELGLVRFSQAPSHLTMMYVYENKVNSRIVMGSKVPGETHQSLLETGATGETIEKNSGESEKMEYWNKGYFCAYGVQKVRSGAGTVRRVFFLNKIYAP